MDELTNLAEQPRMRLEIGSPNVSMNAHDLASSKYFFVHSVDVIIFVLPFNIMCQNR